jgi:nucleoside-diphosphate-sugar epimerase
MDEAAAEGAQHYTDANVGLTRLLLEAAGHAGVSTLVFASSVKAVGESNQIPWTEATPPQPVDPYGASKLAAESLLAEASRGGSLRTVSLRFPLLYGPGMRGNMLRLFQLVDRGVPLPFGRVRNQRSLLYVGNAAAAIEAAIRADAAGSGVFFVRDGRDVSTPELIRLIAAALRRPARLLPLPERLLHLAARGGDLLSRLGRVPLTTAALERLGGSLRVDDRLFRERTGFVPPFTLEQGLGHTAEWFRAGLGSLVVSGTQP